ncbi:MAG: hypothetical protein MUF87_10860 [Anaerolineae bacterium]|nr:hypothetical protein [Anaerolineae bacterium]
MMNLIERIAQWVGLDSPNAPVNELSELRALLSEARQRKYTESYDEALRQFEAANTIAQAKGDRSTEMIIAFHCADIYIRQARWEEVTQLLDRLDTMATDTIQRAYLHITRGTLKQAQGDLMEARRWYEQGVTLAREAQSMGAEGRGLGHLADTYLADGNASYAAHLLRESLPKLSAGNDVELSSYFVGRLGEALIQIGQEQEGDQMLSRALRLAQHTHYRSYERLWHGVIARRALNLGQAMDAYQQYHKLLVLTRNQSPERPQILQELSMVCLQVGKNEEALQYSQAAYEAQPDHPLIRGTYGIVLRANGQAEAALAHLQAGSDAITVEQASAIDVEILRNLAAALAQADDTTGAEATFQRALQLSRQIDQPIEEARTYRDLGLFYTQLLQMQAAIKAWTDAIAIYEVKRHYAQVARLYCDIASNRVYLGQGQRALKDYEQALMYLNSVDLETKGIVLANAATAYVEQGDIETAESFFAESIKIAQKLHDAAAEATRRGNYGWFLMATGRLSRALTTLEYAYKQSEALNLSLAMAVQTDNIGLTHGGLGQDELALQYHRRALTMIETIDQQYWLAIIQCNLAAQGFKIGEIDQAQAGFERALGIGQSLDNLEITIRAQAGLARLAIARNDLEAASLATQNAVNMARRTMIRRLIAEALRVQSELYAKQDQLDAARSAWAEVQKIYEALHHPDATVKPVWLD